MNVYAICGHGTEPIESFIVPKGCTIVVKANPGCYMSKRDYDRHLRTIFCNTQISSALNDPVHNITTIRNAFGPVSIFKEGDRCPKFTFRLMVDFPDKKTHINNFSQASGLIPVPTSRNELKKLCNDTSSVSDAWLQSNLVPKYTPAKITNAKYNMYRKLMEKMNTNDKRQQIQLMVEKLMAANNELKQQKYDSVANSIKNGYIPIDMGLSAKNILPLIYEHSIYPTKKDVFEIISAIGENPTIQEVFMEETFFNAVDIDLETLFTKFPGTYYHFACRLSDNPNISEYLFSDNVYETNNGGLTSNAIPAIYNKPVLEMPNNYQHYVRQLIAETENRKRTVRNAEERKNRRKSRTRKMRK